MSSLNTDYVDTAEFWSGASDHKIEKTRVTVATIMIINNNADTEAHGFFLKAWAKFYEYNCDKTASSDLFPYLSARAESQNLIFITNVSQKQSLAGSTSSSPTAERWRVDVLLCQGAVSVNKDFLSSLCKLLGGELSIVLLDLANPRG